MNLNDIAHQRLHNQLISHQPFNNTNDVVQWMVAMQAQDYLACQWAIGLRTSKSMAVNEKTIEQTIADRKIIRTWPMRGTLHFVSANDVRWMLRLLTPRVIQGSAGRYRQLELDDKVFSKSQNVLESALVGGKQLTRQELYTVLETAGISTSGQRGVHILGHLAQNAVICFGAKRDKQHTFTLLDEYIPNSKTMNLEESLAELSRRYLLSRGPATEYDFSAWAGMKITDARKGFEMVKTDFDHFVLEGKTYFYQDAKDRSFEKDDLEKMYLLPAFDEILCGYKDRSATIDSDKIKTTILKNGIISPIIVHRGKAVGTWKRRLEKDFVRIETKFYSSPSTQLKQGVEEISRNFARFVDKKVVDRVN